MKNRIAYAVAIAVSLVVVGLCLYLGVRSHKSHKGDSTDKVFQSNLENVGCRETARIKLEPQYEKAIRTLVEQNFNTNDMRVVEEVSRKIWDLAGDRAVPIMVEYIGDGKATISDNARLWYHNYCPKAILDRIDDAARLKTTKSEPTATPAPTPTPEPKVAPSPTVTKTSAARPRAKGIKKIGGCVPVAPPTAPAPTAGEEEAPRAIITPGYYRQPRGFNDLQRRIEAAQTNLELARADALTGSNDSRVRVFRNADIRRMEADLNYLRSMAK